ncbi:MAG: hypothetical protein JNN11_03295 [Candidatus Doudnabacteria bacterium]|nr:hypothetical protein [Candidatus Doudnabacteria bacterium]
MNKKVWFGVLVLAILGGFAGYQAYQFHKWYMDYSLPVVKNNRLQFRTLSELKVHLEELQQHIDYITLVAPLKGRLREYEELLQELPSLAKDKELDLVSMIHWRKSLENDEAFMSDVRVCQGSIFKFLAERHYQVVGKEGSWSEDVNYASLQEENFQSLRLAGLYEDGNMAIREWFRTEFFRMLPVEAVLKYKTEYPSRFVTGVEDEELFRFASLVRERMDETTNLSELLYLVEVERLVSWLRTEVAMAKLLKVMQKRSWTRGVLVMGQDHRYAFKKLAAVLALKTQEYHPVPWLQKNFEPY